MFKNTLIFAICLLEVITITQAQTWTQIGNDIDGEAANDFFGNSVSLNSNGSTVAIGAPYNSGNEDNAGHVRIYQNQNGTWEQIGNDIEGVDEYDRFGESVCLSSNGLVLAIGANRNDGNGDDAGHVRIYKIQGDECIQIGNNIEGENEVDNFGTSLSLSSDGSIVAIGAPNNNGNGPAAGHVRVFKNQEGTWSQIGNDIEGETQGDRSGKAVSLSSDGSVVAIGAERNDGNGDNAGHVRVFKNQNDNWIQIGEDIDGENADDEFGETVSLSSDGSIVAIGASNNDDNGINAGYVRVFKNQGGIWSQIGNDIYGEAAEDNFGCSVSLNADGTIVAIGAIGNDGIGNNAGHVRVFKNQNNNWTQIGNDIDGEASEDGTGWSVSLNNDGSIIAIGAVGNDENGDWSGHVRIFETTTGINETKSQKSITIYPNPAENTLYLQSVKESIQSFEIIDIKGKCLRQCPVNAKQSQITISGLYNGMYFIRIQTDIGTIERKIIKK
ncbi:MAG: T9SS type A sorting domain-containing protein [Bacteroidota bacterium]